MGVNALVLPAVMLLVPDRRVTRIAAQLRVLLNLVRVEQ
jgi:hypothetical protein